MLNLYAVDVVTAVTREGRTKQIAFDYHESAAGIAHVEEIAAATPRSQHCCWVRRFCRTMGMATTGIGNAGKYYASQAKTTSIMAIHNLPLLRHVAHGVLPVAAMAIFQMMGFAQACRSATWYGWQMGIHPKQVIK